MNSQPSTVHEQVLDEGVGIDFLDLPLIDSDTQSMVTNKALLNTTSTIASSNSSSRGLQILLNLKTTASRCIGIVGECVYE